MVARKLKLMLIGTLIIGLITGLTLVGLKVSRGEQTQNPAESAYSNIVIDQQASYISLSREEMIEQADIIFLGRVVNISPTRWNQDSGEPWYDNVIGSGLQLHYIEFEVLQPIVDTLGLKQQVTITALGASPLEGQADHSLQVGNEALVFAVETDLVWRDGTRPILELAGAPEDAHFIRGQDGLYYGRWTDRPVSLDELVGQIAQRRETLVQP